MKPNFNQQGRGNVRLNHLSIDVNINDNYNNQSNLYPLSNTSNRNNSVLKTEQMRCKSIDPISKKLAKLP